MRNLILFFTRYYNVFLFLFLELVCFSMLINTQFFHNTVFSNWAENVVGQYYQGYTNTVEYFELKKLTDSLRAENTQLRNRLDNAFYYYDKPGIPSADSIGLNTIDPEVDTIKQDTSYFKRIRKYKYYPAKVINNSINKRNNYITLNKGEAQGMEEPMAVITEKGIAGIVKNVSSHFSVAISVLHNDFHLSCKIKDINQNGSLTWNGVDPDIVQLRDLPTYLDIEEGQEVITSQYSIIFPEGIPVGQVVDYEVRKGDNFYTVDVELYSDLRNLNTVYAIKNLMREEQIKLEEKAKAE